VGQFAPVDLPLGSREDQFREVLPGEHLGRAAEHPLGGRVQFGDPAIVVQVHNRVQRRAQDGALPGLALAERLLGPPPLSDVTDDGDQLLVRERQDADLGEVLALLSRDGTFDADRRAEQPGLPDGALQAGDDRALRQLVQALADRRRHQVVRPGRLAGPALQDRAIAVEPHEQVRERLGQSTQLGARLEQLTGARG
jgi:hypothetical protein